VLASIDRLAFGVCPNWPTLALGQQITLQAALVGRLESKREDEPNAEQVQGA